MKTISGTFKATVLILALSLLAGCSTPCSWCPFTSARDYTDSSAIVTSSYSEPQNIQLLKQTVTAYYNSGGYEQGLDDVGAKALTYLKGTKDTPGKLAIVFDIDETVLSNYEIEKQMDYGFDVKEWNAFILKEKDTAIKPSLTLFNQAKEQGVSIFFITGRPESQREATVKNLNNVGFEGWTELIMKPDNAPHTTSAVDFKAPHRAEIEAKGYRIILNIGDQYSDLAGGYADKCFKYPNPFYFIP